MPKARNPNRDKAYELWVASDFKIKLKDIAAQLNETESTIRKWKSLDGWEQKAKGALPKNKRSAPKKKGGQKGNQNAKGHGAPKGTQNALKHGGYSSVYWNTLTEEEKEMIDTLPDSEELLLIDQIRSCTVREYRLMKAINDVKAKAGKAGVVLDRIIRSEDKRSFTNDEKGEADREEYERRVADKVAREERLPGERYHLETITENVERTILNLESELTRVQKQKTNCIKQLMEYREKQGKSGTALADEWIAAVEEAAKNE